MKILDTFKKAVNQCDPEICWFTTFNLNLELVEKYILSALVGKEPSELKFAEDYEALNLELNKFNVKIWYDYRALDLKQGKRTTVDLYPIRTSEVLQSNSQEPIFHPKVIFIKGAEKAYLITGSFNLSIAGWSSNRECIAIREIKNKDNATQIIDFFRNLNPAIPEFSKLTKWANKLPTEKSNWKFAHNFNTDNILTEIKGKELNIWSPYFSKNTIDLINDIKALGFSRINLIPDVNQSQKVRILPAELKKLIADKSINIQFDSTSNKEKQTLFHAKIWLSENKIAIGSWNCSHQALGIKIPTNQKNIEAGIIEEIAPHHKSKLLTPLKNIGVNTISGIEEGEMDDEWEDALHSYNMSCVINANWETFKYEMDDQEDSSKYTIALPHSLDKRFSLKEINGLSFINNFNRVLKNKLFTIYNGKDEIVFTGYLIEIGKLNRPTNGYVSFNDLFESLSINPLNETSKSRVKYQFDEEDNDGTEKDELPFFKYSGYQSYYLMFVAFQKLLDTIYANSKNALKLEDLGFRLPSSLINIKLLFETSHNKLRENTNENELLFHYFLAVEVNECIYLFNKYSFNQVQEIKIVELEKELKLERKDLKFISKALNIK